MNQNYESVKESTASPMTLNSVKYGNRLSVRLAIAIRFSLILVFLLMFVSLIFVALSNTRAVKELVAIENDNKVAYYQQALDDPENQSTYLRRATECDSNIFTMEEELDVTINLVTVICVIVVVAMALVTLNTLWYMQSQVVSPLIQLREEAEKMAHGQLNLNFQNQSRAEEVYALGASLGESTKELTRIVNILNLNVTELSNKNFVDFPEVKFPGDFATIEVGFRRLVNIVSETLREIVHSAEEVSVSAVQVSSGAKTLAEGATEQASSVDHLSETIADIAKMVADTAQSAEDANKLGEHAAEVLETSSREMDELMEAIEQIEHSSSDIEQIIKTIDDIAFQTNILALNAAIEAARAGQFGKSFAVVADEVRTLAQKSADAAHNTSGLIDGSLEAIRRGTTLAKSTNAAFADVKDSSGKILEVVQHIADSSKHQSDSIDDISQNIAEISNVITNNSTTSEESAAASQQLSGQAGIMTDMLGTFQLY